MRERFEINPARSDICGDEHKDFLAAIQTGMHLFMVSYGFEDLQRLSAKFDIPKEIISRIPQELGARAACGGTGVGRDAGQQSADGKLILQQSWNAVCN